MKSWIWRRRDLRAEMETHLAMATRDQGVARAHKDFGNYNLVAETTRDQWPLRWLADAGCDLRLAGRSLRRSPGFTAVAIAAFALAIGANAAIYAMADGIYFHPLPYVPHEEQLTVLERISVGRSALAPAEFARLRAAVASGHSAFSGLGAYAWSNVVWKGRSPRQWTGARVAAGFFPMLGVPAQWGRTFTATDQQPGQHVAILSYSLWQTQFGANRALIGKTLDLNGQLRTVVGIMPRHFSVPAGADVWLPLGYNPLDWSTAWDAAGRTRADRLHLLARLRPQATLAQAQAELKVFSATLAPSGHPPAQPHVVAFALNQVINGTLTPVFMDTLLAAMGFLLLLACANVANLNLARAAARRQELATRAALGARRGRLARQLLAEALLLALLGGVAGLGVARLALHALGAAFPGADARQIAGWAYVRLSPSVLLFTFLLCLLAAILSGLMPALRAAAARPRDSQRLRHVLLAAQTALALVLLTGSALMFTGFQHYARAGRQFAPAALVAGAVELPAAAYPDVNARARFYDQLLRGLQSTPGVRSAALFSAPPFSNNGVSWVSYKRSDAPQARPVGAVLQVISTGYFNQLHIPLLQGRQFTVADAASAQPVAIVSAPLAQGDWPGASVLGHEIQIQPGGRWLRVVGVAAGVEYDWTDNAPEAVIYRPAAQAAAAVTLIGVRGNLSTAAMSATLRGAVARLDSGLPLTQVQTLADTIYGGLAPVYVLGWMVAALGLIALVLALAGLLGVTAYNAGRRQREIGIRVACGARPAEVVRLVLRQNLGVALLGLVLGAGAAFAFTRVASGFFFGVHAEDDPWALPLAAGLLLVTALIACWLPARRAALADPTQVLRQE